jgi:general transcription factor IIIA
LHEQRKAEDALEADIVPEELSDEECRPAKRRRGGEYGRDWKCDVDGCTKDFKSVRTSTAFLPVSFLILEVYIAKGARRPLPSHPSRPA